MDIKIQSLFASDALRGLSGNLRRQGRLVEAEIAARKAVRGALRSHGRNSVFTAFTVSFLNRVIFEEGRFAEAETLARASLDMFRTAGASPGSFSQALARNLLADALVAQGRWEGALKEYEIIRKGMAGYPKTYRRRLGGNLNWALALVVTGRADEALEIVQTAVERNTRLLGESHYTTAEARGFLGMAYAAKGDRRKALSEFAQAVPILISHPGRADDEGTTIGARDQRLRLILESYIDLLSKIRGTPLEVEKGVDAAAESFRVADVARGRNVQRALAASRARAGARDPGLADLIRRAQDAQRQISAFNTLLSNALGIPTDKQNPKAIKSLRANIGQLRGARTTLREEIGRRFPKYADLINPKPATVGQARGALRTGEALIATYVGRNRTYVWAIPHRGKVAFSAAPLDQKKVAEVVAGLRKSLDPKAKTLGDIPEFNVALAYKLYRDLLWPVRAGWEGARSLLIVAHGALGQLPFSLLPTDPVELKGDGKGRSGAGGLKRRGVSVVPYRPPKLAREKGVLFSSYRSIPWLIRRATVTRFPSVASLLTLRSAAAPRANRRAFVGFGEPYFSESQAKAASQVKQVVRVASLSGRGGRTLKVRGFPVLLRAAPALEGVDSSELARLPRLPETAEEVRGIARALKADLAKDVFLGAAANEHQVKSMDLSDRRVVVFATHGLVPGDLNGLTQPALALSSPKVSGTKGDGLLTMGEILGLRLDADWVVLSACNTASGRGAGAEAVSGLGRAFFYAGTRAVLVSNWPVETTSAKALTMELFRGQPGGRKASRAESLRRAMLGLIDGKGFVDRVTGQSIYSYAHPIFWAPFSLVGDGGK